MRITIFCFFTFISLTQATGVPPTIQNTWSINRPYDYTTEILTSTGQLFRAGTFSYYSASTTQYPPSLQGNIPVFISVPNQSHSASLLTLTKSTGDAMGALDTNGNYFYWGGYTPGTGVPQGVDWEDPTLITNNSSNSTFLAISSHSPFMALDTAGDIWMWGSSPNFFHPLGMDTTMATSQRALTPFQQSYFDSINVIKLEQGGLFTIVMKDDGTLYSFGWNTGYRLGRGNDSTYIEPAPVSTTLKFKDFSVGRDHVPVSYTHLRAHET